jgi:hypothetical protein
LQKVECGNGGNGARPELTTEENAKKMPEFAAAQQQPRLDVVDAVDAVSKVEIVGPADVGNARGQLGA